MAHAAAHLKKARELELNPEYKALQKARERRRRQRERAERKRQVKHTHAHPLSIKIMACQGVMYSLLLLQKCMSMCEDAFVSG